METETNLQDLIEAQGFYITGIYLLAKEKFTNILNSNPMNYDALVYRAHTNLKLNAIEEALNDAETAVSTNSNRHEGLLVKGIALFYQGKLENALGEIQRAKLILSSLESSDARKIEVQKWEQRVEAELMKRTKGNLKKAEEPKIEHYDVVQHHPQAGKVSYKWNQTDNRIYIDINFSLNKKDDLNVKIGTKRVEISFPINESKSFDLNLDLFEDINSEVSVYNVYLDRIEIQLEKFNKGRNWTLLERLDSTNERVLETAMPRPVAQGATPQVTPAYPSSSKVKKDWNKIEAEIEEDMKKNEADYADEDPLNKFLKEIYKNGDDNAKKAMIKSIQTSKGKVLSTNWDEVRDKDYEGKDRLPAPEGQEYREWGK